MLFIRSASPTDLDPLSDIARYHNINIDSTIDLYAVVYWTEVVGSFGIRHTDVYDEIVLPMLRPEYLGRNIMSFCLEAFLDTNCKYLAKVQVGHPACNRMYSRLKFNMTGVQGGLCTWQR